MGFKVALPCADVKQYAASIDKLEPCDNKQPRLYELPKPYSIKLVGTNCDVEINGCAKIFQDVKTMKCKWIVWHNKKKVSQGEKEICGFQMGSLKVNCPISKGISICSKSEVQKNPVGAMALAMFLGTLKLKFECSTDTGVSHCLMGEGKLYKKK